MWKKAHIGDVIVTPETQTNPYGSLGLCGPERVAALTAFKHGRPTPGLKFWFAPAFGGARLVTADEVDWRTSGV